MARKRLIDIDAYPSVDPHTPSSRDVAYYVVVRIRGTGYLVIDLVNTWDPYLADPERLPDTEALDRFLAEHGLDEGASGRALERCRTLRKRLLDILTAPGSSELVSRLNSFIADVGGRAAVARRADGRWVLAFEQQSPRRLDEQLAGLAAGELVELVVELGPERLRGCQAAPCAEVFVDTSRNGRRRYCSSRCANRVNAARHRRRRKTTQSSVRAT